LASGAPTETSLIHLDRSLECKIKELRANGPKKAADHDENPSLKLGSTGPMASDARS